MRMRTRRGIKRGWGWGLIDSVVLESGVGSVGCTPCCRYHPLQYQQISQPRHARAPKFPLRLGDGSLSPVHSQKSEFSLSRRSLVAVSRNLYRKPESEKGAKG